MFEVRSAIHVRTGRHQAAEAVDGWLTRHGVKVVGLHDAYQACVHLLKNYERIPELALIGVDWLAPGELSIVTYVRQTWSRTGIVVYGDGAEMPRLDLVPLSLACRGEDALQKLLAKSPADVLQRLSAELAPVSIAAEPPPRAAPVANPADALPPNRPGARAPLVPNDNQARDEQTAKKPAETGSPLTEQAPPRAILSAEELSALLDSPGDQSAD